jgi:hypothetical protein
MEDKYRDALHAAQNELKRIEERRTVLLRLIQSLKELSTDEAYELTPPPGYTPKGLTEEIRTIMALTTVHLSAIQIRDALVLRGFEYSSPRNLLINVHTVIGRIEDDELDVIDRDGTKAYKAKGQFYPELDALFVHSTKSTSGLLIPPTSKQGGVEVTGDVKKQREKGKK